MGFVVVEGLLGGVGELVEETDELLEGVLVGGGGHFNEEHGFFLVLGELHEGLLEVLSVSGLSGGFGDVAGLAGSGDGSDQLSELLDDGFNGVDDVVMLLDGFLVLLDVVLSVDFVGLEGLLVVGELGSVLLQVLSGLVSKAFVFLLLGFVEGDLSLEVFDLFLELGDFREEHLVKLVPGFVSVFLILVQLVEEVVEELLDFVNAAGVGEGKTDGLDQTVSVSTGSEFFHLGQVGELESIRKTECH